MQPDSQFQPLGVAWAANPFSSFIFILLRQLQAYLGLESGQRNQGDSLVLAHISFGLPIWHSGKESANQCRRRGFDPLVQKIPCRRKWQPIPVFLPGKFHGQNNLVGCSSWGCKGLGMIEHAHTHAHTSLSWSSLYQWW